MSNLKYLTFLGSLLFIGQLFGQNANHGLITGKITDAITHDPLPYTTIQIIDASSETLVEGGISDDNGFFEIEVPYGQYFGLMEFMGYKTVKTDIFQLSSGKNNIDLGEFSLISQSKNLDEVVVQAEKSTFELKLDKRVFNVGKDLGNAGGSAVEILNNIPSVVVDGEGQILLRGSGNVRILIDGKPSGLVSFKGSEGLQQLQASMIERVEIITNPSARYEAEGMAGIINIVLKKTRRSGFNGAFDATTGYPVNLGLGANMNYRHKDINFFINYGINYRKIPSVYDLYQEVYSQDTIFLSTQTYDGEHIGFFNNIRGGLDYFLTDKDIITVSYMYSRSKGQRLTDLYYEDFVFNRESLLGRTYRTQNEDEVEPISEYVLNYKKQFSKKDHELNAQVRYFEHWEESDQVYEQMAFFPNGNPNEANTFTQTSFNAETENQLLGQIDYTYPFSDEGKVEAGWRSSLREMDNDYLVQESNENGGFVTLPGLDDRFIYEEIIHAAYAILGNKFNKFSFQLGLRAEWTDIETILEETAASRNPRKYNNLFPSAHITYDLPDRNAIQLSYSRRIRRPVYNDLSSFVTFSDNRNYFSGNPDLNPDFSDVYELGHIKYFNEATLSTILYYRHTTDKIERIRLVDDQGFSRTQPENLKGEDAFGLEFNTSFKPNRWWKLDFNFNAFYVETDGSNINPLFVSDAFTWFTRQTSRFNLPKNAYIQLRANYEAPQNIAQGKRKALYYFDIALNKEILKGKGTLNLNIADIFNTRRNRVITQSDNFFTEIDRQRIRRQINLTMSYRID